MSDSAPNEDAPTVAATPQPEAATSPSSPTTSEPDAGSAVAQAQAAREAAAAPVAAPETPSAFDAAKGSLRLEVLRLAQLAGAKDDPGHPATPDEVVTRAGTYWDWMTR